MKRAMSLLLAAALCAGLLAGCGASSGGTAAAMPNSTVVEEGSLDFATGEAADAGLSGTEADRLSPNDGRKIIYNASLEKETEEYDATRDKLLKAASDADAWVQGSDEGGSAENGSRWVRYTFRVPSDSYADFLNDASAAGSVTYKSETTEDVTADYVDLEARLESLRTQEARLLELAGQAGDLADLLAIEEQLAQVRYEIESYTGTSATAYVKKYLYIRAMIAHLLGVEPSQEVVKWEDGQASETFNPQGDEEYQTRIGEGIMNHTASITSIFSGTKTDMRLEVFSGASGNINYMRTYQEAGTMTH